jgi:cyclic 2,3-diphosphoglycerate synthetase
MAEPDSDWERVRRAVAGVVRPDVAVVGTILRPRPAVDVRGRSVAYFSTAPGEAHATLAAHLTDAHGAHVVHISGNLANRDLLRRELADIDAEVFLIELKAAAVDVVAEAALVKGAEVVLAANDIVSVEGEVDLDETLLEVAKLAL